MWSSSICRYISYLYGQDKSSARQKNHVRFTGKCMLYSLCQLILHAFPFQNKQFTVYKFSNFYKHANPNNQPYYYIITFTQYTKIRITFLIDMKGNNSHCLHDRLLKVHSCETIHNYITKLNVRNKILSCTFCRF